MWMNDWGVLSFGALNPERVSRTILVVKTNSRLVLFGFCWLFLRMSTALSSRDVKKVTDG
jgi:hypothetical protein